MSADRTASSAATKVLTVLSVVARSPGPHRIVDLAHETGLAKATVHRMLQHLVEAGFVVVAGGATYAPGPRLLGIAAALVAGDPRRPLIRQGLERLRKTGGLSAHFAQAFDDQVVTVDSVESTDPYGLPARPGQVVPLDSTAFGIAIRDAADDPPSVTVLDAGSVRSVAAPVFEADDLVLGSIGVSGTTFSLTDSMVERLRPVVSETAAATSAVLRARAGSPTAHRRNA